MMKKYFRDLFYTLVDAPLGFALIIAAILLFAISLYVVSYNLYHYIQVSANKQAICEMLRPELLKDPKVCDE